MILTGSRRQTLRRRQQAQLCCAGYHKLQVLRWDLSTSLTFIYQHEYPAYELPRKRFRRTVTDSASLKLTRLGSGSTQGCEKQNHH